MAGLSFVVGFYIIFVLGLAALILVFGTVGRISAQANKVLNGIAVLALVLLGVYQIAVGAGGIIG